MTRKFHFLNKLLGQEELKREVGFYLEAYSRTGFFAPMIAGGARGLGKSLLVKAIAAEMNVINKERGITKGKQFLSINAAEIKGSEAFVDKVLPLLAQEGEILLFIDEINNLSMEVQIVLLTLLSYDEKYRSKYYTSDGNCFDIDHTKFSFASAASSFSGVHPDLIDRLKRFQMQEFTENQLGAIIQKRCNGITFEPEALEKLGSVCRNNARNAVARAEDVKAYGKKHFTIHDFNNLRRILSIYPLGLNRGEVTVLKHLATGPKTLTELSARMNCTKESLMSDLEQRLKACNLMKTAGVRGRVISTEGMNVLKEIEEIYS